MSPRASTHSAPRAFTAGHLTAGPHIAATVTDLNRSLGKVDTSLLAEFFGEINAQFAPPARRDFLRYRAWIRRDVQVISRVLAMGTEEEAYAYASRLLATGPGNPKRRADLAMLAVTTWERKHR